jgi:hypothetical protein
MTEVFNYLALFPLFGGNRVCPFQLAAGVRLIYSFLGMEIEWWLGLLNTAGDEVEAELQNAVIANNILAILIVLVFLRT